jgi:hypothetical protein
MWHVMIGGQFPFLRIHGSRHAWPLASIAMGNVCRVPRLSVGLHLHDDGMMNDFYSISGVNFEF